MENPKNLKILVILVDFGQKSILFDLILSKNKNVDSQNTENLNSQKVAQSKIFINSKISLKKVSLISFKFYLKLVFNKILRT